MPRVRVQSVNAHNEIEWEETLEAKTLPAAKGKATKFLNYEFGDNPSYTLSKYELSKTTEIWSLR